ncbi:MAG: cadherin-like domain-containing protein [Phycisphaerales bacterium]|nr:cadherin-like domain-containing protein [Phycisphaerales bacterium]
MSTPQKPVHDKVPDNQESMDAGVRGELAGRSSSSSSTKEKGKSKRSSNGLRIFGVPIFSRHSQSDELDVESRTKRSTDWIVRIAFWIVVALALTGLGYLVVQYVGRSSTSTGGSAGPSASGTDHPVSLAARGPVKRSVGSSQERRIASDEFAEGEHVRIVGVVEKSPNPSQFPVSTATSNGKLKIAEEGRLVIYTANPTPTKKEDQFLIKLADEAGKSVTVALTLVVIGSENSAPSADNIAWYCEPDIDQPIEIPVLPSTRDPDGEGLTLDSVGKPDSGGVCELDSSRGVIRYKPAVKFHGKESFSYTVTDAGGLSARAKVEVRVPRQMVRPNLQLPVIVYRGIPQNIPIISEEQSQDYLVLISTPPDPQFGIPSQSESGSRFIRYMYDADGERPDEIGYLIVDRFSGRNAADGIVSILGKPAPPHNNAQ